MLVHLFVWEMLRKGFWGCFGLHAARLVPERMRSAIETSIVLTHDVAFSIVEHLFFLGGALEVLLGMLWAPRRAPRP